MRRARLTLERLEAREVPATLVNPTTLTYQDFDGDDVKVVFSKPVLTATNVSSMFVFDNGGISGDNSMKQQLRSIMLSGVPAVGGASVSVIAMPSAVHGGDGFAALGQIDATGLDLGPVTIDGDLGRIKAGDTATSTTGLAGLNVLSLGRYSTATGAPDLYSEVRGKLGSLKVQTDVTNSRLQVWGNADGTIGSISIGGSLVGTAGQNAGAIGAQGDIGSVTIKGDIVGGAGLSTGLIVTGHSMTSLTVGGSIVGAAGGDSGLIRIFHDVGPVKIGGSLLGSTGHRSGHIEVAGKMGAVTIGGCIKGASGDQSGYLQALAGLGAVSVKGDVSGGAGKWSGVILCDGGKVASVTIGGALTGGAGDYSGSVTAQDDLGPVTVRGSVTGGAGFFAGAISSLKGKLASANVGGSVVGGTALYTGVIQAEVAMGQVAIGGDVIGGLALAGVVSANGPIASVSIGGSLCGGTHGDTGAIFADGNLGRVTIAGDIVGSSASGNDNVEYTGIVRAKRITAVTVGGSIVAGVNQTTGAYFDNGCIRALDDLGTVTVRGSLLGNNTNPVIISARGSANPAATSDVAIGSVTVGGRVEYADILAGVDHWGMGADADAQIGSVTVVGDWIASSLAAGVKPGLGTIYGTPNDTKMSGVNVKDLATVTARIGSVTIGGQAFGSVGVVDYFGIVAENIGLVKVGGTSLMLKSGAHNDALPLGLTGDFYIREI